MQKHSWYVARHLAAHGIKVRLYHYNDSTYDIEKLAFFSEAERANIESILIEFPKSTSYPGHYLRASRLYSKHIFEHLRKDIGSFDFFYTKGFSGWELIEQKHRGDIICAPVGVKFHGYEMFQRAPDLITGVKQRLLLRAPARSLSRKADYVFSYGGKITSIVKSLGVKSERIVEIPSGVEREFLVYDAKRPSATVKFLFLGRYERRKGIEELSRAIGSLGAEILSRSQFHFVGPIPAAKQLHMPNVVYHGELRDPDALKAIVSACDVLLAPSWSEGMPNSILEGMARGLAVIATDVGANALLVSSETGWLLPGHSPHHIAKAITGAVKMDPAELFRKKSRALKHVRSGFTWDIVGERLIDFLNRVAKNPATAGR